MKRITTVNGDISPNELGYTSMHEHTLVDLRLMTEFMKNFIPSAPPEKLAFKLENYAFLKTGAVLLSDEHSITDDVDYLAKEINAFKDLGGKSIVDASPIGLRGNLNDLKKVSEVTGVNIICATGLYLAPARPEEFKVKDVDFLISRFEKEIKEGMDAVSYTHLTLPTK